jgi:signal transduction histidine kinase
VGRSAPEPLVLVVDDEASVRQALERALRRALLVRVEDDGPGVAAADRERLLEPFARGTGATAPGTGVGLAIVAQQVALHAGELTLTESALGGLAVHVRLPVTAVPALTGR